MRALASIALAFSLMACQGGVGCPYGLYFSAGTSCRSVCDNGYRGALCLSSTCRILGFRWLQPTGALREGAFITDGQVSSLLWEIDGSGATAGSSRMLLPGPGANVREIRFSCTASGNILSSNSVIWQQGDPSLLPVSAQH